MPALKTKQYNNELIVNSIIGRALAHPARLRIIELIHHQGFVRNVDLIEALQLSKSSISNHINKLKDASLIETHFMPNSFYNISFKSGAEERLSDFLSHLIKF